MASVTMWTFASAILLSLVIPVQVSPQGYRQRLYDVLLSLQDQNTKNEIPDDQWQKVVNVPSLSDGTGQSPNQIEGYYQCCEGSDRKWTARVVNPPTNIWDYLPQGTSLILQKRVMSRVKLSETTTQKSCNCTSATVILSDV